MTINEMITKVRVFYPHWNPKDQNQLIAVYHRLYSNKAPVVEKKQPEFLIAPKGNYIQLSLFDGEMT